MPGRILHADERQVLGWAWHDRLLSYNVLLHLTVGGLVVQSVIADKPGPEGAPAGAEGHWFEIDLSKFGVERGQFGLLIGETDEFATPFPEQSGRRKPIAIEELLHAPFRRRWIVGMTHVDAEQFGLSRETVVDMFYRDYLGRPADEAGLSHYSGRIRDGSMTVEGLRHDLLGSDEYKSRNWKFHNAPGAIFSQRAVLMAPELRMMDAPAEATCQVSVTRLLALDDGPFVEALYLHILGRPIDSEGRTYYLRELSGGRDRLEMIVSFGAEPEAVARNVEFVDLPDGQNYHVDTPAPMSEPVAGDRLVRRASLVWPQAGARAGWQLAEGGLFI